MRRRWVRRIRMITARKNVENETGNLKKKKIAGQKRIGI